MKIYNKDYSSAIKTLPDCSQNTIFADPPYSLGSEVYIDKNDGKPKYKKAKDFMNKWEFGTEQWEVFFAESFRVQKHGGYNVMFSMDRQSDVMIYYARLAGYEVCQKIYWYFIQNFPKAHDISKGISSQLNEVREVVGTKEIKKDDNNGNSFNPVKKYHIENNKTVMNITQGTSELSQSFEGYKGGIAPLKQTVEEILIFRKPLKNGSLATDVIKSEKDNTISAACLNINDNRIPIDKDDPNLRKNQIGKMSNGINSKNGIYGKYNATKKHDLGHHNSAGRYPANTFADTEAADILDAQSGILKKAGNKNPTVTGSNDKSIYKGGIKPKLTDPANLNFNDTGGCSKILNQTLPYHNCIYVIFWSSRQYH